VPASLLLGVTTHVTTNLAPVPLLWVIPLALYLVTYVVAFAWPVGAAPSVRAPVPTAKSPLGRPLPALPPRTMLPRWLPPFVRWQESPWKAAAILPVALLPLVVLFFWDRAAHGPLLLLLHLATFFLVALACHARLAAERPAAEHLTGYYLWIALGGALGGIANGLAAPFVFPAMVEVPARPRTRLPAVAGPEARAGGCAGRRRARAAGGRLVPGGGRAARTCGSWCSVCRRRWRCSSPTGRSGSASRWRRCSRSAGRSTNATPKAVCRERSVFGAHRVERSGPEMTFLVHGNILDGAQDHRPERRREPLTYYHRQGPCGGQPFAAVLGRIPNGRVAAVGLGVGSIAAYGAGGRALDVLRDRRGDRTHGAHAVHVPRRQPGAGRRAHRRNGRLGLARSATAKVASSCSTRSVRMRCRCTC
jgi:hypothetical protein